ncbi:hypothetical protein [Nocardiopsis dassonvillei]|uniref:hypothetical protein n=1 Tax=Nocardiopsis dassonvillei TaxID=2014 RepID=UPI00367187FA
MTITKKDDSRIRRKIASKMKDAQKILTEPTPGVESPWIPQPNSEGSKDIEIEINQPSLFNIPIEINLPLSWSRCWLIQASKRIVFSASALTKSQERITNISPLLRSATEEALWSTWLLEGRYPQIRLARGLLAEMEGSWSKIQYFNETDHGFTEKARGYLKHLQERSEEEFPDSFKYSPNGKKIVNLGGESYPKISKLYIDHLPQMNKEPKDSQKSGVYGEASSPTHAIAGLTDGRPVSYTSGQFIFDDSSNLHDEGRIIGPACLAFAQATNMIHSYLGFKSESEGWILSISEALIEWCSLNGCEEQV